ncbi:hypothetical protein [Cytophaga aurantiaca]|uniref:hypothetical protein n=1 Tax=Cytophaga aurantiaca TaxID=29530 RepID=UPI00036D6FEA|nr:hypothetical protein [Cytophaga aurantiaca]
MLTVNNKILFIILSFALALGIFGGIGIAIGNIDNDTPLRIGVILFIFTGTYILAKNGIFIQSDEYRFTRLGISIFTIGLLMRFMHWSNAQEIMFMGYISIPLIYLYHMIKHKRTQWPQLLKFALTFLIVFGRSLAMFHMPYSEEVSLVAVLLLLILLVDALKNKKIPMNG